MTIRSIRIIGLVSCLWAHAAHAADAAHSAELALHGDGPYHLLQLPMSLQSRAASPALRDIQVLNARGEAVPFAWVEALPGTAEEHEQTVPMFKLPGPASGTKATPPRSWMIDTRAVSGCMLKLDLTLPESARGVYSLAVETSDDLQQWRTLLSAAQVVSLEHQGQRLESTSIDLGGVRGKYLRLTALTRSLLPELQSARVTSVTAQAATRPVQWSEPLKPIACGTDHCDYALPRNVPLEEIQWQLAEVNTLARAQLSAEVDASLPPQVHHRLHHLRHPLRTLREKSMAATEAAAGKAWLDLLSTNLYWLHPAEGEVHSGPVWLDGGFYSALRIRTSGPISLLGVSPPTLRLGARTPTLLFLARGPAPFRLAWGDERSAQPPVSLSELMPARKAADPLPSGTAEVVFAAASAPASAAASMPASSPAPRPAMNKPVWLWTALLTGLAAMGFMAWSLLRRPMRAEG